MFFFFLWVHSLNVIQLNRCLVCNSKGVDNNERSFVRSCFIAIIGLIFV